MTKPCPVRDQAIKNFYATSPVLRTVCTNFTAMFLYIQNYTGLNLSNCPSQEFINNVILIQDTLLVEVSLKQTNLLGLFEKMVPTYWYLLTTNIIL